MVPIGGFSGETLDCVLIIFPLIILLEDVKNVKALFVCVKLCVSSSRHPTEITPLAAKKKKRNVFNPPSFRSHSSLCEERAPVASCTLARVLGGNTRALCGHSAGTCKVEEEEEENFSTDEHYF